MSCVKEKNSVKIIHNTLKMVILTLCKGGYCDVRDHFSGALKKLDSTPNIAWASGSS